MPEIITCPSCGKEINAELTECPHCHPLEDRNNNPNLLIGFILLFSFFVLFGFLVVFPFLMLNSFTFLDEEIILNSYIALSFIVPCCVVLYFQSKYKKEKETKAHNQSIKRDC